MTLYQTLGVLILPFCYACRGIPVTIYCHLRVPRLWSRGVIRSVRSNRSNPWPTSHGATFTLRPGRTGAGVSVTFGVLHSRDRWAQLSALEDYEQTTKVEGGKVWGRRLLVGHRVAVTVSKPSP